VLAESNIQGNQPMNTTKQQPVPEGETPTQKYAREVHEIAELVFGGPTVAPFREVKERVQDLLRASGELAAARAEDEADKKRFADGCRQELIDLRAERDQLRAEVKRLKEWSAAKTNLADDLLSEVRELRAYRDRMEWLHRGNDRDAEGYEWGIFRVKWDEHGQPASVLHTNTDLRDLDAAMGASRMPRYYDELADVKQQLADTQAKLAEAERVLYDHVALRVHVMRSHSDYALESSEFIGRLRAMAERTEAAEQHVATLREATKLVDELLDGSNELRARRVLRAALAATAPKNQPEDKK
jgi:hypothetical protein